MKKFFSATDLISQACSLLNKNLMILVVFLVGSFIGSFTLKFSSPQIEFDPNNVQDMMKVLNESYGGIVSSPLTWISSIIEILVSAAVMKMAFDAIDGKSVGFENLKMPFEKWANFFAAEVLSAIIIAVGLIFCILPGIFLAVKLVFAPAYTIDRNLNVIDAIKASWNDTTGNFWHLLGTGILMMLFTIAGFLLCCVGYYYTAPAATIALALLARVFSSNDSGSIYGHNPFASQNIKNTESEEQAQIDQTGYTKQY